MPQVDSSMTQKEIPHAVQTGRGAGPFTSQRYNNNIIIMLQGPLQTQ
jgi:hypothetical protein